VHGLAFAHPADAHESAAECFVLDWCLVDVTHPWPTLFADSLLAFGSFSRDGGVLRLLLGDGHHAPIAAEDLGHVIASILENPPHAGQTYPATTPRPSACLRISRR
jgi:uncharacterized protein YbjT (DUF2867 family)